MKLSLKIIITSFAISLLSACVNTGCDDYHSYRAAKSNTPIKVPADLEQPDNESVAPEVKTSDKTNIHKDSSGKCLEKPPKI